MLSNTIFQQSFTLPNQRNLSDPRNYNALVQQQRQFLTLKELMMGLCGKNMDIDDLKYMGTSTVVRDLDFMAKVLDGPEAKM
jgi:hypothetical protein